MLGQHGLEPLPLGEDPGFLHERRAPPGLLDRIAQFPLAVLVAALAPLRGFVARTMQGS